MTTYVAVVLSVLLSLNIFFFFAGLLWAVTTCHSSLPKAAVAGQ